MAYVPVIPLNSVQLDLAYRDAGRLGRGRGHGGLGFGNAAFAHGPGHNESLPGGDAGWSRTSTTFRGRGRGTTMALIQSCAKFRAIRAGVAFFSE